MQKMRVTRVQKEYRRAPLHSDRKHLEQGNIFSLFPISHRLSPSLEPSSSRYQRRTETHSSRLSLSLSLPFRDALSGIIPFPGPSSAISPSIVSPLPFQSVTLLFRSSAAPMSTTPSTRRGQTHPFLPLRLPASTSWKATGEREERGRERGVIP